MLQVPRVSGSCVGTELRMALKADTARNGPVSGAPEGLAALSLMVAYTKTDVGVLTSGRLMSVPLKPFSL